MIPHNRLPQQLRELMRPNEEALSLFQTSLGKIKYLVTSLRVINCINPNNIRSCYYSSVYNLFLGAGKFTNKILLITDPNIRIPTEQHHFNFVFLIEYVSNSHEAFQIIQKAWQKESPYMQRIKPLVVLAKKYNLNTKLIHYARQSSFFMSGKIEGIEVEFLLETVQKPRRMHIKFLCPNPKFHYLLLRKERTIEKVFGIKEREIGDNAFDKMFFIKSDDVYFLQEILTPMVKENLMYSFKYMHGVIEMGEAPSDIMEKEKTPTFNVDDQEMLLAFFPERDRDAAAKIALEYTCDNMTKNISNINIMIKECMKNFNTLFLIAKRIEAFYE